MSQIATVQTEFDRKVTLIGIVFQYVFALLVVASCIYMLAIGHNLKDLWITLLVSILNYVLGFTISSKTISKPKTKNNIDLDEVDGEIEEKHEIVSKISLRSARDS